jgi:hypothetical protein
VDSAASSAEETTEAEAGTTVPLPAATIRKAKARPAGETADKRQDSAAASDLAEEVAPSVPAYAGTDTYPASSYSSASNSTPSSYTRSEWVSASAPAPAPGPASAAGGPGAGSRSPNGYSSGVGSSSGAASAVSGAAAGFASSMTSAWQKRGSTRGPQGRKPSKRQAMLTLARVEPWSVMKFSFVASVVAFIILFVAVAVLYMVLSALGVFDSLQNQVSSITSSKGATGTNISHWFSASLILGYTAMLGALNIVLITAMATVGSVIYNLIAKTIGGIEVTLRETD